GNINDFMMIDRYITEPEVRYIYETTAAGNAISDTNDYFDGGSYTLTMSGATDALGNEMTSTDIDFDLVHELTDENTFVYAEVGEGDIIASGGGGGGGEPGVTDIYYMRAYNTDLSTYVYWDNADEPDETGASSGYDIADL